MDFNERNVVKIDFATMEQLVRDSERLARIKDYISSHIYLDINDMKVLAGMEFIKISDVKVGEQ